MAPASGTATSLIVTSVTLLDATTGRPVPGLDPLPEGAALILQALPASVALRANTSPAQVATIPVGYNGYVSY